MNNTSNNLVINPLHCERKANGGVAVMYGTIHVGEIEAQDDGFYAFYPKTTGYWTSHNLRNVADLLDTMNRPWEQELTAYFTKDRHDADQTSE